MKLRYLTFILLLILIVAIYETNAGKGGRGGGGRGGGRRGGGYRGGGYRGGGYRGGGYSDGEPGLSELEIIFIVISVGVLMLVILCCIKLGACGEQDDEQ